MRLVILVAMLLGVAGLGHAQTTSPAPVMTEELMSRMIKFTWDNGKSATISERVAAVLGAANGNDRLPVKQMSSKEFDGEHFFSVLTQGARKQVIVSIKRDEGIDFYLTDTNGMLRAAAIWDANGIRPVPSERVGEKHRAELSIAAKFAKTLPVQ